MKRSWRGLAAWLGIFGIAFGALAATAHACHSAVMSYAQASTIAIDHVAAGGCATHADDTGSPAGDLCEMHCNDGAWIVPAVELPPVALNRLPVSVSPLATLPLRSALRSSTLSPSILAPPLVHQFCRMLV